MVVVLRFGDFYFPTSVEMSAWVINAVSLIIANLLSKFFSIKHTSSSMNSSHKGFLQKYDPSLDQNVAQV